MSSPVQLKHDEPKVGGGIWIAWSVENPHSRERGELYLLMKMPALYPELHVGVYYTPMLRSIGVAEYCRGELWSRRDDISGLRRDTYD